MGVDRITTLNLRVVQTDVERGLILVEGAVPGSKGGWIAVRDAVKKALPKDAPKPGKFRRSTAGGEQAAGRSAGRAGERVSMKLKVTTLDGKAAGSVELSDDDLRPRAARGHHRSAACSWQLAKRQAGTHKMQGPRRGLRAPARRCTSRRAPAVPVTARPACRSSAAVAVRSARWSARTRIDLPKKVRALALQACAVGQGQGRRPDRDRQRRRSKPPRPRR